MRILLVEDDSILGDGIRAGLKQQHFAVDWVRTGEEAYDALSIKSDLVKTYSGVVLDIGLPGMSGLALLQKIRTDKNDVPVLILTARDTIRDRVEGLDKGADDYLVKPFSIAELGARLRALLRRNSGRATAEIHHGHLTLIPASHRATWKNREIELSAREYAIIQKLVEHAGSVLSREQLEESLYGWNEEIESNAIEVHIHHLRRKFSPDLIRTIRGVGYIVERLKK